MNRKIFGLLVSIIFIANIGSAINVAAYNDNNDKPKSSDIIVVGVMDRIDETQEYRDYEIHVAVVLDESIDIYINQDQIIRLYNFHGLEYHSVVVAFVDSAEII
jgi:hypothetical protein